MGQRLFLHVGTPKSGTTYLQSVWWANQRELQAQGLLLPGTSVQDHFWASSVVRDHAPLLASLPARAAGSWDRMLDTARRFDGDVLISHELFSRASREQARDAVGALAGAAAEVHVVLTARDLARQVPAEWQQRTKHGRSQTYSDFVAEVRDRPSSLFWEAQDVPAVLERWSQGVPPERVHLVVLPPPGGPRSFLWDELCSLTGVDGAGMVERVGSSNESLGLAEAETMRRVSSLLNQGGLDKPTERLLKGFVAETVLRSSEPEKIVLPADARGWVVERARRAVEDLAPRGYHVVGDLADLLPAPDAEPGRDPADLGEDEVAAVAVRGLARFVEHERAVREQDRPPTSPGPGRRSTLSRVGAILGRARSLLSARAAR